jgi:hypothetical protein
MFRHLGFILNAEYHQVQKEATRAKESLLILATFLFLGLLLCGRIRAKSMCNSLFKEAFLIIAAFFTGESIKIKCKIDN